MTITVPRVDARTVGRMLADLSEAGHRISLWRRDVCAPAGIDLVLRASELTRDEDGLYHTRANCLLLPLGSGSV